MATQPSRPWFRLATMARPPPTQQPDQAPPPPRPAFIRPAFTQVSRPTNVVAPTSPPVAPSPTVPKASMAAPATSPPTSSPAARTISQPPSPLVLPPPQPEYEQKTVLMQETKKKLKGLDNGRHDKPNSSDSDDVRMRIITIAGENKGAVMDLTTPFSKKTTHKQLAGSIKTDNPTPSSDSDNKSGSKKKNQKSKSSLMSAVMNSNVQGVNNSILYNSCTNHHDPGVHLSLSRKPSSGTK